MTADVFKEIEERGACVDLSRRAKFRLTGADRVRYLNGQVTNDVKKATRDAGLRACVTNVKGRIEAEVFIHVSEDGDSLLIDTEESQREAIAARLDRYIVADDVTLEDVTDQWTILHCFGRGEQGAGGKESEEVERWLHSTRFGVPGSDRWAPVTTPLPPAPCSLLSPEDAETLRVLRGIPRWPNELNGEAFPQEAGLEATAMDFAKGCYIGQEVLSRIKTTGRMPRVLRRFMVQGSGFRVEADMKLVSESEGEGGKEAGVVTSVALHPLLDRTVGLAYVRQAFGAVDSLLLASEDPPRILGKVDFTAS